MSRRRARWGIPAALCALLAGAVLVGGCGDAPSPPAAPAWPAEILSLARTLPVQDEGRIKPFSTWARFELLQMNHKSSLELADDSRLDSLEWALDVLLRPAVARDYRCLRVEDDAVLTDVGLRIPGRKKADRYSFAEIEPARARLAARLDHVRQKLRVRKLELRHLTRLEQGLYALGTSFETLDGLLHHFDFARDGFAVEGEAVRAAFGPDRERVFLGDVLERMPDLVRAAGEAGSQKPDEATIQVRRFLERVAVVMGPARHPRMLPPSIPGSREWRTPWDVASEGSAAAPPAPEHIEAIRRMEALVGAKGDPGAVEVALRALHEHVVALARARGAYDGVELEAFFYALDPFYRSLQLYLLAFVLVALTWLRPALRWAQRGVWGLLGAGLVVHAAGIVLRCILRERPPVSTLYETVIFISGVAVLALLLIERVNRQRIAIALAPVLGALGLFMAQGYADLARTDTMPQLVAVLDTNFWLATHVVCISIGYAAGLLAGILGHVYVLGQAFGLRAGDRAFYAGLGRMVYGTVCFALLFSVTGTILGGIWANDSWGRFWGWDPKENGALLIVIWQIVIVHARLGGYVKALGISMMAVFGTAIVAFSWWHVNLLGIGLHSYGFTQGVLDNLRLFYAFEAAVLLTGGVWWLMSRQKPRTSG